ncbi:hypothetical protein T552_02777 [Pneumocystis carinii B80]|uniref:Restriction of telomere capping protein 1 n=1 Tax=Pneumocystis carinii (strain B80) TaxID=1408658 RepID=A0A0W4ZEI6_PNEC8|nr:hypothetical protein T552_02777 [Pneumocystis carinii B80]KTW26776.1 hypothetical protein T552_02777 [Pneumocystis carinii B80]
MDKKNDINTFIWKAEGSLLSLAANQGKDRVAVVGREVLKILDVYGGRINGEVYLYGGNRWSPTFSSCDVKWGCGGTRNILATASTNGSIVLWDLTRPYGDQIDRIITEHFRSVNRLAFNHLTGYLLLSGSQDGNIKLWDLRDRNGTSKYTMQGKAESVRDIQFNPNSGNEFIAGFENGSIQLWDIRKPNIYERKINAHNGLTLTLDWHSDGRHIATGGRDRMIKVWDMFSDSHKPISVIQTMAPVSKIAWRPISNRRSENVLETEIASCSLVSDYKIYIWDIRRPYIPCRVFDKHDNVTTGIVWKDENYLWSCSKDKTFIQHSVSTADIPLNSIPIISMDWSPLGDLSIVLQNRYTEMNYFNTEYLSSVEDESISRENKKHFRLHYRTSKTLNNIVSQLYKPLHISGTIVIPDLQYYGFTYLAQHYNITASSNLSVSQACENNANFALNIRKYRTGQTWKILQYLVENKKYSIENSTHINKTTNTDKPIKHDYKNNDDLLFKMSLKNNMSESKTLFNKASSVSRKNVNMFLQSDRVGKHFRSNTESILLKQNVLNDENIFDKNRANISLNDEIHGLYDFHNNFETISQSFNPDFIMTSFTTDFDREKHLKYSDTKNNNLLVKPRFPNLDTTENTYPWSLNFLIQTLAEYYSEIGDIQMCATIVLLMSKYTNFDSLKMEKWIGEYIELLQKYRLFITMTEVINASSSLLIRALNQSETSVYINCYSCQKPIINQKPNNTFSYCKHCRNIPNGCTICDIPVKGQYLWCQSCGHGGHTQCLKNWFINNYNHYGTCPAIDCNHHCALFIHNHKAFFP